MRLITVIPPVVADDDFSEGDQCFLQSNMTGNDVKERMKLTVFARRNAVRGLNVIEMRFKTPRLFDVCGMVCQTN